MKTEETEKVIRKEKASYEMLRRWLDYAEEFKSTVFNRQWFDRAEDDKETVREMLGRGIDREVIRFVDRKKMLVIDVDVEFLKRVAEYINEFEKISKIKAEIVEAKRDKIRVYRMLRRFRKRNTHERKLRKLMPLNVKDVAVA